jgi:hypothetical protein
MATPQDHYAAAVQFQECYDTALSRVGVRAPEPVLGETVNHYRCEALRMLKSQFHKLYKVNYRRLRNDSTMLKAPAGF